MRLLSFLLIIFGYMKHEIFKLVPGFCALLCRFLADFPLKHRFLLHPDVVALPEIDLVGRNLPYDEEDFDLEGVGDWESAEVDGPFNQEGFMTDPVEPFLDGSGTFIWHE